VSSLLFLNPFKKFLDSIRDPEAKKGPMNNCVDGWPF